MIHYTLDIIMTVWFAVSLLGFIFYKCELDGVSSFEEGIKFCTLGLIKFCYEELTGKTDSDKVLNQTLILSNKEVIDLIDRYKAVFEFPKLCQYFIDSNGIMHIDMSTVALVSKYKDISASTLREIICNITQEHFHKIREYTVDVYIPIATESHVLITIPLSEYAKKVIRDNQKMVQKQQIIHDSLEENFSDEEDTGV